MATTYTQGVHPRDRVPTARCQGPSRRQGWRQAVYHTGPGSTQEREQDTSTPTTLLRKALNTQGCSLNGAHPHPPGCHPHLGALPGPASPFAPSWAVWITSSLARFPCLPTPHWPSPPPRRSPPHPASPRPHPRACSPPLNGDHESISPNHPLLDESELMFSGQLFEARDRLLPSLPDLWSR